MKQIIDAINKKGSFGDIEVTEYAPAGKWADVIAKDYLGKEMKTTQLRKVFTTIKQMDLKVKGKQDTDAFNDPALYMLIPNLAYAKARGFIKSEFYELIKAIVGDAQSSKIKKVKDFKRFSEFMTAIVAYHKQYSK
jgi:CRISPR-associated protein Csm2